MVVNMILNNTVTLLVVILCFNLSMCFTTNTFSSSQEKITSVVSSESIKILNAWARPSIFSIGTNKSSNSAIYLEIFNNSEVDYNLVNVSSDIANRVELHKSFVDEKGVSKMVRLDKLVIPAKSSVVLQPSGIHIMLLGLKRILKIGNKFDLFLYFDNSIQKIIQVKVESQ